MGVSDKPWTRLHLDDASINGQDVLIVVDAFSKWIEAICVNNATSATTVRVLRRLFSTHGIPETVVTDNGTQFVSEEFSQFLSQNGLNICRQPQNIHRAMDWPREPFKL